MMRRRTSAQNNGRYRPVAVSDTGRGAAAFAPPAPSPGITTPALNPTSARVVRGTRGVAQAAASIWKDPYRLALMGLVIDSTSHVSGYYLPVAKLRPGLIMFCLAIVFALSSRAKSIDMSVFRRRVPILILIQGFLACSSALFGINLGNSAHFIIDSYSKTLVLALLLVTSVRGIADVRRATWALVIGGVVLALLSILVVGLSKAVGAITWDSNDVGLIMVMNLPLLFLFAQTSRGFGKLFALIGVALAVTTIIMSDSRGAFLGMIAVG